MNEDILRFEDPPENQNGGEEDILYFDDVKDNQDDEDILYFDDVEETEKFRNPFTSNQNLDKKEVEKPVEEIKEPIKPEVSDKDRVYEDQILYISLDSPITPEIYQTDRGNFYLKQDNKNYKVVRTNNKDLINFDPLQGREVVDAPFETSFEKDLIETEKRAKAIEEIEDLRTQKPEWEKLGYENAKDYYEYLADEDEGSKFAYRYLATGMHLGDIARRTTAGLYDYLIKGPADLYDMVELNYMAAMYNSEAEDWEKQYFLDIFRKLQKTEGKPIDDLSNKLKENFIEYDDKSITEDILNRDYGMASAKSLSGIGTALPSIILAYTGLGGIAVMGASSTGLKFDELMNRDSEDALDMITLNSIGTGITEAAFELVTRGILKRGKELFGKGSSTEASKFFKSYTTEMLKKLGIDPAKEGFSEFATAFTTGLIDFWTLEEYDDVKFTDFFKENWKNWYKEGEIGWLSGGGITAVNGLSSNKQSHIDAAVHVLTPESDKKTINDAALKINELNKQLKEVYNKEDSDIIEAKIMNEQAKIIKTKIKVKEELDLMTKEELTEYASNKDKISRLGRRKDSNIPYIRDISLQELSDLELQNEALIREAVDRRLDENIKTVGVEDLGRTVNDYNSKEEYQKAYNNTEQGKKNSMNVTSSDGFISEDGDIYINREVAQKVRNVNVAAHELLHGILNNNIKEPGQLKKLVNEFKAILPRDVANKIQKRIDDNYRFTTDEQGNRVERPESEYMEEYFTAFADLIGNRQIKFNENIFTKIGEKITPIFKGKGYGHIKFETGKDVYNFIKDYQKQVAKGELKPETIEAARKVAEQDVKMSKTASDKVQEIYNDQGVAGALDIIQEFKPIVNKIVERRREAPGFDRQLLTDEIETGERGILDLIQAYDPKSGVPLAAYINKFLPSRAIEASKRVLGEVFEGDIAERVDIAEPTTAVEEVEITKKPKAPVNLRRALDIEKGSDLYNKVKDVVAKTFGTRIPSPTDPKFKKTLQDAYATELTNDVKELMGKPSSDKYKTFLQKYGEQIYDLIPQDILNKSYQDFIIERKRNLSPTEVDDAISKGLLPSDTPRNSGPSLFTKKPYNQEEFVEFHLAPKKGRPASKQTQLAQTIAKELGKDATLEVLEDPKVFERFTEVQKIEGKKVTKETKPKVAEKIQREPGIKFSLTTKKDLNWKTDEAGNMTTSFRVNNKKYNIELYPVDNKGDYRLNFNLETKDGTTREITATGDSFKVFSIVYNGVVEEIQSNPKIKSFQFEADKSEPTRVKLYTTLMNKLADRLGWESDIYETTDWDGGGSFDFELVKPKIKNTVKKELDKINKSKSKEKKSGKEELDMIVDAQGLANIRGDVNSLRSVMFMVADKAKKFGLDGINKILMPGNLTSGNRIDLLRKFGFNVISNPDKIKDTKLRKQAYQAVKEGEFLNLSSVLKEVTKGVKRIKNNDVEAFQIALGAKSGEAAKRNASRKKQHDRGVKLVTELELDIFLESVEGEAFIRLIGHNDKLNKNGSRNQALPNSAEVGAIVNGKRRSETTDEHQWQANEWVKGKLKLFKNIKNNVGTKQEKVARKALDLYLDLSKDNYTQFLLKNETDIIKGDLTNNKGKVWKKSGSTLHPILKEKLNNFIDLAGRKNTTEKQLQEAFDEIPSADIRYFSDYGYVNPNFIRTYKADGSYTTKAEEYNVVVPEKFKNDPNVRIAQGKIIETIILTEAGILTGGEAMSKAEAKQAINEYLKIAPEQQKASKFSKSMLNDSKVLNLEGDLSMEDLLSKAATLDNALANARKLDAPVKKIRVFDFDDTLARTKSIVFYTKPDGSEGQLTAEEFAEKGADLVAEGAVMDFSDFNIVREGKRGPLFDVAKKIRDARGNEDLFVLTARAPESADAIYEFLKSEGLEFKKENIVGLGNSTGAAKANWIVDKAADGYNDFYFADDAYANVQAVQDALDQIDVKSKVQQAKIKFSKSINEDFNKIIEQKTGIASEKRYSKAKAKVRGANKGNKKFFIPYSAEDFMGLVYPLLSKGKLGDNQMAWFKEHLLDPYGRAIENLSSDRIQMMQDFKELKKSLEVPKDLRKTNDSGFTNEQAVRVYLFNKMGYEVPGLSKTDLSELVDIVNSDGKLKAFADQILSVTKGDGYVKPSQEWLAGTITTDLIDLLNTTKRRKYLEQSGYLDNANEIFSTENLNKLEAAYGAKYREAVENTLSRMKSGKNRMFSGNRLSNRVLDYINGSIGTIMFFNTRSAVLQTISAVNFLNWSFNNPYKAGKAFANQPQYWKDFKTLMNSDYLTDRRNGLKLNISENEIANAAATAKNKARGAMNYILQKGYLPTQFADSFAIASGGATFYRNRINDLVKQGIELKQAEQQALSEWKETAEISQQSSDPSKISQQQASDLGRVILAFANTPMQYARIQKRAFQDLVNKRGDAKTHVSKIIYYGVVQNLIFNALQQALFAIGFGDDEDEENEKKYLGVANGMLDSTLRGLGIAGATVAVIKNFLMDIYERSDRARPEYVDAVYKLLQLSPSISSKISKIRQAAWQFDSKKRRQEIFDKGFSLNNPAYEAAAKVISATTNLPLDRVLNKVNNIEAALGEDAETWQIIAMLAGWPEWQIMAKEKKKEELPKFEGAKVKEPKKYIKTFKKTIVK